MDVGLVCDGCSAFNPWNASTCSHCQGSLSLEPDTASDSTAAVPEVMEAVPSTASCSSCGAELRPGNRFCGACGTPVPTEAEAPQAPAPQSSQPAIPAAAQAGGGKQTLFFSSIQAAKAKLVLIKGEGLDGESYALAGSEHRIGRSDADIIFDEDPFLSPTHANFFYVAGKLMVKDEGSINGVYLRIRDNYPLEMGGQFLVGEQIIEVRPLEVNGQLVPTDDGTYFYSSPKQPCRFELVQILESGAEGICRPAFGDSLSLGRENNDLNFPEDPFISGNHAQVSMSGNQLTLTDMGSKNGTFVRLNKDTPLSHGDYVFMGQQLLRIEIV